MINNRLETLKTMFAVGRLEMFITWKRWVNQAVSKISFLRDGDISRPSEVSKFLRGGEHSRTSVVSNVFEAHPFLRRLRSVFLEPY